MDPLTPVGRIIYAMILVGVGFIYTMVDLATPYIAQDLALVYIVLVLFICVLLRKSFSRRKTR